MVSIYARKSKLLSENGSRQFFLLKYLSFLCNSHALARDLADDHRLPVNFAKLVLDVDQLKTLFCKVGPDGLCGLTGGVLPSCTHVFLEILWKAQSGAPPRTTWPSRKRPRSFRDLGEAARGFRSCTKACFVRQLLKCRSVVQKHPIQVSFEAVILHFVSSEVSELAVFVQVRLCVSRQT